MPFLPKMQALDAANAVLAAVSVYVFGDGKMGGNSRSFYRHFCGFNVFGR